MRPKVIGIAAAGIVVVGVIAIVAFLLVGRSSQRSAANQPATATGTTQPSAPVVVAALDGLFLSPDQVDTAMGATGIKVTGSWSDLTDPSTMVRDVDCQAINDPGTTSSYNDSGWSAVRGQKLEDGADIAHDNNRAVPNVVLFPSADQAAAFFAASSQRWPVCSSRQYTAVTPNFNGVWDVGPVSDTNGTLRITRTQENTQGWACQRALTVSNNVAIDILACSYNPANSAVNMADQIAAKIARQ